MELKLPRYCWLLLLLVGIAGLARLLLPTAAERAMRKKYDRIRLGMTPAEVRVIMKPGHPRDMRELLTMDIPPLEKIGDEGPWPKDLNHLKGDTADDWYDSNTWIQVFYRDGKAIHKRMMVPTTRAQFSYWLYKLRRLVGWQSGR
jgi:hypothetical protein